MDLYCSLRSDDESFEMFVAAKRFNGFFLYRVFSEFDKEDSLLSRRFLVPQNPRGMYVREFGHVEGPVLCLEVKRIISMFS